MRLIRPNHDNDDDDYDPNQVMGRLRKVAPYEAMDKTSVEQKQMMISKS